MDIPWAQYGALIGSGLAMGIGAIGPGLGLGLTAVGAVDAIARQPAVYGNTFRNMLVAQAVTETPAIFSLVIAFLLFFSGGGAGVAQYSLALGMVYIGAGLCIGIGSLGSGAGSGMVGTDALRAMARCPSSQGGVMMYMLIGQAWAQTGVIFALVVALLIMNAGGLEALGAGATIFESGKYLGAGIGMGLGAIGPAVGIAYVAGKACRSMALLPAERQSLVRNTFFVGSATAQSTTIYALIISLLMIYSNM